MNDCVTGVVTAIIDQGLRLTLLCIDKGVCRDIEDLNIPVGSLLDFFLGGEGGEGDIVYCVFHTVIVGFFGGKLIILLAFDVINRFKL